MSNDKTVKESKSMKEALESQIFDLVVEFEKKTGVVVDSIDVQKTMDQKTYQRTGETDKINLRVRI